MLREIKTFAHHFLKPQTKFFPCKKTRKEKQKQKLEYSSSIGLTILLEWKQLMPENENNFFEGLL